MPKVLQETEIKLDRADLRRRTPVVRPLDSHGIILEAPRTPGIHLSGVLRYIATEAGLFKTIATIDEEELPLRMALGFAWEEFCVSLYPGIHYQPGEIIHEGVAMTCDGHSIYTESDPMTGELDEYFCLEEFKLTWKKVKCAEEIVADEWYWMQQGRGYCWGYGANLVRWHVCYINGDYRGSGPIYKRFLIKFDDRDVESTARVILNNKAKAALKGHEE